MKNNTSMNIIFNHNDFDISKVYFITPIKNRLLSNSSFYKLFYTPPLFILNTLYIKLDLKNIFIKQLDTKICLSFNTDKNKYIISKIKDIELLILKRLPLNKVKILNCSNQLHKGFLYVNNVYKTVTKINTLYIKISGIWESEKEYGLSYKFSYN